MNEFMVECLDLWIRSLGEMDDPFLALDENARSRLTSLPCFICGSHKGTRDG